MSGAIALVTALCAISATTTPSSSPSTPSTSNIAAPAVRYVYASSAKLRAAPTATAPVRQQLPINAPLTVLEQRDGFARVRTRNGKEGWVAVELLSDAPLTSDVARAKAAQAAPDERLTWLQRAAAIDPTEPVLRELQTAYRADGNVRAADMLEQTIANVTSRERLLAIVDGQLEFTTLQAFHDTVEVTRESARAMATVFWALPPSGPATRVTPTKAEETLWIECAAETGISVTVDVPTHAFVIALRGAPPASWQTSLTPWDDARTTAATLRAQKMFCRDDTGGCRINVVGNVGVGGFGSVVRDLPQPLPEDQEKERDTSTYEVIDVVFDKTGAIVDSSTSTVRDDVAPPIMPLAIRDIVGDAALEVVIDTGCGIEVRTLDGSKLFASVNRCCGC